MPSYDPDDAAGKLAKKVPLKYANDGTRLFTTSSRVKDAINTARVAEGKEPSRILSMDVDSMADAAKFGDETASKGARSRVREGLQKASELADQYTREGRRTSPGMKKGGKVSASSRADGCAQRGKTKGRMV